MFAPQTVEFGQHFGRGQCPAVQGHRVSVGKGDFDGLLIFGRVLQRGGQSKDILGRSGPGIFQNPPLVTDMQQITVGAVRFGMTGGHGNAVVPGKCHQRRARIQLPVTPGSDDRDAGIDGQIPQFKAHLVVALAGGPVADRIGPFQGGDFHLTPGDQGAGDGGSQKIAAFVNGIGPEHGVDIIAHEFFFEIFHICLYRTGVVGILLHIPQRFGLSQVGGESHHFTIIGFDQPFENHRSIQSAGIGQYDLAYF